MTERSKQEAHYMRMRNNLAVILVAMAAVECNAAAGTATNPICEAMSKEKQPTGLLIGKNGEISAGPIDFGRYAYTYSYQDAFTIPTNYKLLISPARVKIESCDFGCLAIKKVKSICPGTAMYEIGFRMLDKEKRAFDSSWLPHHVDSEAGFLYAEDQKPYQAIPVEFKFISKVVGEIYDGSKH